MFTLGTSHLHELRESKLPCVSRIEFIRSKHWNLSAHVSAVGESGSAAGVTPGPGSRGSISTDAAPPASDAGYCSGPALCHTRPHFPCSARQQSWNRGAFGRGGGERRVTNEKWQTWLDILFGVLCQVTFGTRCKLSRAVVLHLQKD